MAKEILTDAERRVKEAGFQRVKSAQEEEGAKQRILNIESELAQLGKDHFKQVRDILGLEKDLAKVAQFRKDIAEGTTSGTKEEAQNLLKGMEASIERRKAIIESAGGMLDMAAGAKSAYENAKLMAGSMVGSVGLAFIAVKAFLDFQKAITDTRKELGVSYIEAAKITSQNRVLAQVAKGYGLELDDITSSQAAIRNDLGASVQESVKLSLSFARTSAATGQTSEDLAKTLSIMESISGASRDVLLNQIRTNAAMIEAAGIAPALVMKDIAQNAEFFASYAKDGGQNIIQAGIAARKLGLEMSAVASITDSLLDFETSIEKQLEASMLLGRQINYDRARQLALAGDTEGVMQEILKQVGGEVEFNRMNVLQRRKLAESVNVSVEQLSRLVRNNQAAATGGAVGAAVGKPESVYSLHESGYDETHRLLGKLVRNTEGI